MRLSARTRLKTLNEKHGNGESSSYPRGSWFLNIFRDMIDRVAFFRGEVWRIYRETIANVQAGIAIGSPGRSGEIILRGIPGKGRASGREKFGNLVEERQQRHVTESRQDRAAQRVQVSPFPIRPFETSRPLIAYSTGRFPSKRLSHTMSPPYDVVNRFVCAFGGNDAER